MTRDHNLLDRLGIRLPIIQAPMAGTATPQLAAAVSNAGGLGSLGLGSSSVEVARQMICKTKELTPHSFNTNVFCHRPAVGNTEKEKAWVDRLAPEFNRFNAPPPQQIREIYTSFRANEEMFEMLLEEAPRVISFHFGLPEPHKIKAFKNLGIILMASATNVDDARQIEAAGIDVVIAQGWEAGGHRGCFDENEPDTCCGVFALTRLFAQTLSLPVVAAGGIMDGAGIRAALALGASAAQLGTAFVGCDESNANQNYRAFLARAGENSTVMTRVVSGRPARCLTNNITRWGTDIADADVPDYPKPYDAAKALNLVAASQGEDGFGAYWAGQGAPLARAMPAQKLMETLERELAAE
ncbi:Nitronate monooxygenase [Pseudovibrio axinellae]|uniref:Nitronate monooxygenase n=1 Tax=Pseudovibrio axinellae TaxID=989403 RepID=A0A165YN92_9HYPH|nr:nitronate monooxygenase [Pseudovibrio axinellae]KZL19009.1 Nitronate monooxygenase [Pseudovibrio axinellae]SEP84064.1 nitronate monooxygenase [Pseudovibrio axinellae]